MSIMEGHIQAKQASSLGLPKSSKICHLSIIDTTCSITVPLNFLVEPDIAGYDYINLPDYSFHIKHADSGKELLFDLGTRYDWWNLPPHITSTISGHVPGWRVEKDPIDILKDGGIDLENIEAFVLSHWHFDHCGNPSALPTKVKMLVGPGFREAFMPGYPKKESSPLNEADFEGRDVEEVQFDDATKIGQFQAHNYFGDGSFYILNVPGHAVGHICGLVRTTPDSFVLLGGDCCHHTGMIRPSEYIPMPYTIPEETALDKAISHPCPCSAFLSSHPDQTNGRTVPFFKPSTGPASFYVDPKTALESTVKLREFDADPNVLIAIAHDPTSLEVFDFFPTGKMNDWKAKGWKERAHWGFLSEMPYNGKTVRPPRVDGLYRDGKKVRGLDLSSS